MLTYLSISHYTVAEHIELELQNGMTAITGETGAGKSLMIDALEYCLGARADTSAIRSGCKQFEIIAQFDVSKHPSAQAWLKEHELSSDNECILRRVVKQDGRSLSTINGVSVPLQLSRQLATHLVAIHGQHEHQSLLKRDTHRTIVDVYGKHQPLLDTVQQHYQQWRKTHNEIESLTANDNDETRIEFLRYQLQELRDLQLAAGELKKIEQEHKQLTHADSLLENCHQVLDTIKENEPLSVNNQLEQSLALLDSMKDLHPSIKSAYECLNNACIQNNEAANELQQCLNAFNSDPQRLQQLEQRLQTIYDIARKHRIKATDIPQQQQSLAEELKQLTERDSQLEHLQQLLEQQANHYFEVSAKLSLSRRKTATILAKKITNSIRQLAMPNASCHIEIQEIEKSQPQANGMEQLELYIITNPGAAPQPLKKIASGGELSRISLAIQVIAAKALATPTLLFDEVDVGIGGATAETVGGLLKQLGKNHQVICVTHQPQVAAQSHQHLRVEKITQGKTTSTTVTELNSKQQVEEIARMMGGHTITEQTRAHARELLTC